MSTRILVLDLWTLYRTDPAFLFFAHKVQPMLVKKGCMMIQCHSASMFHDYRLHGVHKNRKPRACRWA